MLEWSKHAPAWRASEERWSPASSPSLSPWRRAQRAGRKNGGPGRRFSAAQMARSVSGRNAIMGGTLTSGHGWLRQISSAPPQTPVDSVEKWRGWWHWNLAKCVCISVFLCPSRAKFYTCGVRALLYTEGWQLQGFFLVLDCKVTLLIKEHCFAASLQANSLKKKFAVQFQLNSVWFI